ncbi:MAG: SAVED domain-containing protein [Pseudomonas gingeri]
MPTGKRVKEVDIKRVVVVELRGLVDTSDHPLTEAVPKSLTGRKVDALVDVRQLLTGPTPNVSSALLEISHMQRNVRQVRGDTARAHVQVVAGGIMPVPLLFYSGVLLDDEGHVLLMDWERASKCWKPLADPDDGTRFVITCAESARESKAVVLAVSASYLVDMAGIEMTFPGLPLVHMERQVLPLTEN